MKMKMVATIFALLFTSTLAAQSMKLKEVLNHHFAAIGQHKLDQKSTITWNGTSAAGPFTLYQKRPNKVRIDAKYQGEDWIRGYNGQKAWIIAPWFQTTEPQPLTEGPQFAQLILLSQFDGPLHNPQTVGGKLKYAGMAQVDGKAARRLKLIDADGTMNFMYIDMETGFLVKQVAYSKDSTTGGEIEVVTLYKDYRQVDDVLMAFRFEILSPKGVNNIVVESLEFEDKIDDSWFEKPTTKTVKH